MAAENRTNKALATDLLVTGTRLVASVTATIATEFAARKAENYRSAAEGRAANNGETLGPTKRINALSDIADDTVGPPAGSAVRNFLTGALNDVATARRRLQKLTGQ